MPNSIAPALTSSAISVAELSWTRNTTSGCARLNLLRAAGRWPAAMVGRQPIAESFLADAPVLAQLVEGHREAFDHVLDLRQEREPGRGQRHLAGRPRQEPDAEILLELAHPVAERRLRQVEMGGRELEAAALRDGDEGVQAEKVDPHRAGHPVEARPCMQEIH